MNVSKDKDLDRRQFGMVMVVLGLLLMLGSIALTFLHPQIQFSLPICGAGCLISGSILISGRDSH